MWARVGTVGRYVGAALLAGILISPLVWAVSGSLHSNAGLFSTPFTWIPRRLRVGNYAGAWKAATFGRDLANSIVVGVVITVVGIGFGHMAGYALGKRRFLGRDVIFWSIVGTLLLPFPAIMVPVFIIAKDMGIVNSYMGIIVPGLMSAQVVFFMRQYLRAMPEELLESARLDGASEWQLYRKIVVPLSWPVIAAMGILTFVASWNNLLWPLIVIDSRRLYTMPIGLTLYSSEYFTDYVSILAMSVVAILPIAVLVLLSRRRLLDAIMVSGGALSG